MNNGVKRWSECEDVGQGRRGCDAVEKGRDYKALGRAGGREIERVRPQAKPGWGYTYLRLYVNFLTPERDSGSLKIIPD